jgi:hypothetical protein
VRPVSSLLDRFRRSAAVPAAADEAVEAELVPVFAALDEIEDESRRLLEEAGEEAERRMAAGAADAEEILERWRRRAEEERIRAESERRRAAAERVRAIEAAGEAEARDVRARGFERIPALLQEVLACVTGGPG